MNRSRRLVVSTDGSRAAGMDGGNVSVFARAEEIADIVLEEHPEGAANAVFTPDGRHLATAEYNRRLAFYDLNNGGNRVWEQRDAHRDAILALDVNGDGSLLATGGQDRVLRIWDTADGRARGTMIGHRDPILAISFSDDGSQLITCSADRLRLSSLAAAEDLNVLKGHTYPVRAMAISSDGAWLAS
jgi:WD40 repeat protein